MTAVQLPLTSLEDDIAVTRNALSAQKGPTIVVGHSYGGAVITGAANDAPNVTALVYIAAFRLDEGEDIEVSASRGPVPARRGTDTRTSMVSCGSIARVFAQAFAGDATRRKNILAVVQKPLSIKSFAAKSGPPAWKHIPSWYLVSSNDQMIPPQAEEFMAKRMGATVRTVAASHASMVSHPQEVADIIGAAAQAGVAAGAAATK